MPIEGIQERILDFLESLPPDEWVRTTVIANAIDTKAEGVNHRLKLLKEKGLIECQERFSNIGLHKRTWEWRRTSRPRTSD